MPRTEPKHPIKRRTFVASAAATAASLITPKPTTAQTDDATKKRKIKLGVVGCGGRGKWITGLFQKDGGYEIHAVADYFQEVADAAGDAFGVDKTRRFSGLTGD